MIQFKIAKKAKKIKSQKHTKLNPKKCEKFNSYNGQTITIKQ